MASLLEFKTALYGEGYDPASFKVTRMVGTSLPTASLKTPHVHAVFKAYRQDLSLPLEDFPLHESVELTLCYFLLSLARLSTFKNQMDFLSKKLPFAESWMITDTLGLVLKKSQSADFKPYFLIFVKSKAVYERRFAYVWAMRYYREEKITFFLDHLLFDEEYYVMMAQAWMLATLAITHFDEITKFLQKKEIPLSLKRKAISKMRDSYRISVEEKEILKRIRDNG